MSEPSRLHPKRVVRGVARRARNAVRRGDRIDQTDLIHAVKNELVSEVGGVKGQLHANEAAQRSIQDQQAMTGTRVEAVLSQLLATRDEVNFVRNDILAVLERVAPAIRLQVLHEARLVDIDEPTAAFLNYAKSHRGPLADAGLWLNEPVVVEWLKADARVGAVNERIVEQPYVHGVLGGLAAGARVLDIGGGESTVGLSLASLGRQVTVLEPAGYGFAHPDLTVVEETLEDFTAGGEHDGTFDAVVLLSAIEHFGIGAYANNGVEDPEADIEAMARVRRLLVPGGRLALTTPFGPAAVDELERTYDADRLGRLLDGFVVDDVTVASRRDETTWQVTASHDALTGLSTPAERGHVVMVTARTA